MEPGVWRLKAVDGEPEVIATRRSTATETLLREAVDGIEGEIRHSVIDWTHDWLSRAKKALGE